MFSESSYLDIYSNPMSNPLILETFYKLKSGNFSVEDFSYKNNAIFGSLNLNVMTPSDPKALPMNYRDSGDALDLTDNFIVEWIDMKNAGRSAEEQDTYISLKDMLYASQNIINKNEKKQFLEESIKTLKEKNVSYTASVILNEEENIFQVCDREGFCATRGYGGWGIDSEREVCCICAANGDAWGVSQIKRTATRIGNGENVGI